MRVGYKTETITQLHASSILKVSDRDKGEQECYCFDTRQTVIRRTFKLTAPCNRSIKMLLLKESSE